jgi:heterotetrameric sarcosine oxidase delta subunit
MVEFSYGGDANNKYPGLSEDISEAEHFDYVYLRDNPCGEHQEYWHHVNGCRQWLKVKRNTLTHEVVATVPANSSFEGEQE